ncbi:hypothetical protein [Micromonospora sp. LOL_023]|uniref:hypothetical protein n=1 Tax=Micromonospora sp. LOL_023 TaxID=3345418 RepID=UPI003A8A0A52
MGQPCRQVSPRPVRCGRCDAADATRPAPTGTLTRTYAAFVGLTLLNPMTIAYFAALVVGHQGDTMGSNSNPALVGTVFVISTRSTGLAARTRL